MWFLTPLSSNNSSSSHVSKEMEGWECFWSKTPRNIKILPSPTKTSKRLELWVGLPFLSLLFPTLFPFFPYCVSFLPGGIVNIQPLSDVDATNRKYVLFLAGLRRVKIVGEVTLFSFFIIFNFISIFLYISHFKFVILACNPLFSFRDLIQGKMEFFRSRSSQSIPFLMIRMILRSHFFEWGIW